MAGKRADVRDVLIYRDIIKPKTKLADFPTGLTVATSSTRRKAQILALRPDFKAVEIRGNVPTRLQKTGCARPTSTRPSWPAPDCTGFTTRSPPAGD